MNYSDLKKIVDYELSQVSRSIRFKAQQWNVIDNNPELKKSYVFQKKDRLIIVCNGQATFGNWEIIGKNTILISEEDGSKVYDLVITSDEVTILRQNNTESLTLLVSEELFKSGINSIERFTDLLTTQHRSNNQPKSIQNNSEQNQPEKAEFISKINLRNGDAILCDALYSDLVFLGKRIYDLNETPIKEGIFYTLDNRKITVENYQISNLKYLREYNLDKIGTVIIEQSDPNVISRDDELITETIVEGNFKISWSESIKVVNNIVVNRKIFGFL